MRWPSTRTNISGEAPTNCFLAELQEELVRAWTRPLNPPEKVRRLA